MGRGRRGGTAGTGSCLSGHRRTAVGFSARCAAFSIGFFAVTFGGDDVFVFTGVFSSAGDPAHQYDGQNDHGNGKNKEKGTQYDNLLFEFLFFLSAPVRHVRSCQITAKVCSSF